MSAFVRGVYTIYVLLVHAAIEAAAVCVRL